MNALVIKLLKSYMIMPLLAIILVFVVFLMLKKNKLFSNKKAIFYILLCGLVLSIPGLFGFLGYDFMPFAYIALFILYLFLGWGNIGWIRNFMPNIKKEGTPYIAEFLIHFIIMFTGAAFFSLIFNLCNELEYGLWACTCMFSFIFPSLFSETVRRYLEIPLEVHKIWHFSYTDDLSQFEYMDFNKLMVLELEFTKQLNDEIPVKVKVKAPDNMTFGTWFQKFIVDYNVKFPLTPIELRNKDEEDFGWIFYVKQSFFLPRKYIDFNSTIPENKLNEKHTIIAKRVLQEKNEDDLTNLTL
jgi:hypothetical protein